MDINSFRFEARLGCPFFCSIRVPSFHSRLFLFLSVAFFSRHVGFHNFSKKEVFFSWFVSFHGSGFFFCFCFSAAKVSNGRLLLYFLCSDLVLFAHLIESSIIFRRPGKKNSAAHRFRRRRRRCCRHRRRHRERKPFSAETATGTFPELSRLKNRKRKRLH